MKLPNFALKFRDHLRDTGLRFYRRYSPPRWLVLIADLSVVFIAFFVASLLRYNFAVASVPFLKVVDHAVFTLGIYCLSMIIFRSYSGLIRHTTVKDIFSLFLASTAAVAVLIGISFMARMAGWKEFLVVPVSILIIHYVLITMVLSLFRILIKEVFESLTSSRDGMKNVLIFGAGILGVMTKRIIEADPSSGLRIRGFIDDDHKKRGKTVNQLPIHSAAILDRKYLIEQNISVLLLAVKDLSKQRKAILIKKGINMDLEVLEVPPVDQWLQGKLSARQLQKVKPEDLLGRDPIVLNTEKIMKGLEGKTVLVTGAAGSIGSELVRQLARFSSVKLVLADQAETPTFYLKNEIDKSFRDLSYKIVMADVTNRMVMEKIFLEFRPQIVFHAAAYKHVPLMEENPQESVRVNVGGTKTVADLSAKYNVEKFVMISSDKAVNPANVMGASKRLCELYVQSLAASRKFRTQFVTTRFGNVLGSNGSVIPLFKKQIESGGPVTVTHPDIKRYFMTIPEACQLVLEAAFLGQGGEIFVFDMGHQVRIYDIARQIIKLYGFIPEQEIKIAITGLRPGEKLYEELLSPKEKVLNTHHPKIMIARNGFIENLQLNGQIEELLDNLYRHSKSEVVSGLMELVPEFVRAENVEVEE